MVCFFQAFLSTIVVSISLFFTEFCILNLLFLYWDIFTILYFIHSEKSLFSRYIWYTTKIQFFLAHNFFLNRNHGVTWELVTPNFQINFFIFCFYKSFTCKWFWPKNNENEVEKFLSKKIQNLFENLVSPTSVLIMVYNRNFCCFY